MHDTRSDSPPTGKDGNAGFVLSLFPEQGPRNMLARLTGGFYLAFVAMSILAGVLGRIGTGSARQVLETIQTGDISFRVGLVAAFVSALLFLLSAWGLHGLLRSVNRELALLFLLLNSVGVAIQCSSMLMLLFVMLQADPAIGMDAFSTIQRTGLGRLAAATFKTGFITAQLFYGTWLFPLGYLVCTSGFLPKVLGFLLLADGVFICIWFLQVLLLPSLPMISYPGFVVSFVAEVGLGLWLLVKGVSSSRSG